MATSAIKIVRSSQAGGRCGSPAIVRQAVGQFGGRVWPDSSRNFPIAPAQTDPWRDRGYPPRRRCRGHNRSPGSKIKLFLRIGLRGRSPASSADAERFDPPCVVEPNRRRMPRWHNETRAFDDPRAIKRGHESFVGQPLKPAIHDRQDFRWRTVWRTTSAKANRP